MNPATRTTALPWWMWLLQFAVILAVAELFYRLVEVPFARRANKDTSPAALKYAIPAVAGIFVVILAFAPLDWDAIASARAEALRPELAQNGNAAIADAGADADGAVGAADVQDDAADETTHVSPDAEKVPANLDATSWTYDEAAGTCDANALIIGDSVTEGAASTLQAYLPNAYVDGQVSRQLQVGPDVYREDIATGYDASVVIVALGGNSLIRDESIVQSMIDVVDGKPLYFVTIRSPYQLQDINNEILRHYAEANDNVGIIDWCGASEGHSEYLVDDGVHLTTEGCEAFAQLIRRALCGQ